MGFLNGGGELLHIIMRNIYSNCRKKSWDNYRMLPTRAWKYPGLTGRIQFKDILKILAAQGTFRTSSRRSFCFIYLIIPHTWVNDYWTLLGQIELSIKRCLYITAQYNHIFLKSKCRTISTISVGLLNRSIIGSIKRLRYNIVISKT